MKSGEESSAADLKELGALLEWYSAEPLLTDGYRHPLCFSIVLDKALQRGRASRRHGSTGEKISQSVS